MLYLEAVRQNYKPDLEDQRQMGKALGKSMGKSAIADKEPREPQEPEPEPAQHHLFRQPAPPRPDVRPADTPEDTPEVSATPP